MSSAFMAGMTLGPQLHAIWVWRGMWRLLAAAPLLLMALSVPAYFVLVPTLAPELIRQLPLTLVLWLINSAGMVFVCLLWLARLLIRLATAF